MFLLGIYCAGSYGGSISAILINTPGTPHAAATMLDGNPLAKRGLAQKALNIALEASTFGGIFSALVLLFLAPQVAKVALKFGASEIFILCVFGISIIAGVSGDSLAKGIISGCIGLFLSIIGMDVISGTFRFTLNNYNLYAGFDLVIVLIGLFALSETISNSNGSKEFKASTTMQLDKTEKDRGKLTKVEYLRMLPHVIKSSIIGVIVGVIPGTGASMASFFSYDRARKSSKHPEEFGNGSIEGIAAAESANNAVTGATLIPLLTLGIPGDAAVAILLGTLMANGLTPGPNLFQEHGLTLYAIMVGLVFINIFMYLQGKYLTGFFAKVTKIPSEILIPIIVVFCFAGSYSIKSSMFDLYISIAFGIIAYISSKIKILNNPSIIRTCIRSINRVKLKKNFDNISRKSINICKKTNISCFLSCFSNNYRIYS